MANMDLLSVSLFSGAGGLDVGVDDAGFETICAIEIDEHCVSTLRRNSPDKIVWHRDVTTCAPTDIAGQIGIKPGELTLLHGGPPCQPFSQIGKRAGMKDPRGKLVFEMVRFAAYLRPDTVFIEQVPKFLGSASAAGSNVLDILREEFYSIGYDMKVEVLNALDYGVPQRRHRAMIVCVPTGQKYKFPSASLSDPMNVGDVIADLPAAVDFGSEPLVPNHIDVTPDRDRERISYVSEGQWLSKAEDVPPDVLQKLTPKDTTKFRRVSRREPSLTLRCGEALYHPVENRYLTPRESARIQGFPDCHVFDGPIRRRTGTVRNLDQHRQVANAVPPPLAYAVAMSIRGSLCL